MPQFSHNEDKRIAKDILVILSSLCMIIFVDHSDEKTKCEKLFE